MNSLDSRRRGDNDLVYGSIAQPIFELYATSDCVNLPGQVDLDEVPDEFDRPDKLDGPDDVPRGAVRIGLTRRAGRTGRTRRAG